MKIRIVFFFFFHKKIVKLFFVVLPLIVPLKAFEVTKTQKVF